ncbi:MAG: efflux RND transporter periplasmic adaptor subunit [Rhizomicrobium sp.]|jgi:membrane fusion protein (multidrug efflux system)
MNVIRANRLVLCLAGLVLTACGHAAQPQQAQQAPEVGIVVIRPQPAVLTAVLPGRTSPHAVSDVRPQVTGILKSRLFTEGAIVKQGQALYQIEPAPFQAAYDNAVATLADSKAKADRYAALLKQNAIAPQDYDDAEAAYKQAIANVQTARINLAWTRITAPISGRIGRSSVTEGALVTADQTTALATIDTLDPIYVDITQSTDELLALKLAMQHGRLTEKGPAEAKATLTLGNGAQYPNPGRLLFSEVTVDETTGAVTLRAEFPNPDGILLPGMFVRATIVEGEQQDAILAPQQGVSRDEKGEPTAYVVDAKGIARLRNLTTSRTIGDKWLVTAGLNAGDRLIVEGLQNVTPNAHVRAVPASLAKTGA